MIEAPARPPLRYFGSKWGLAPWIITHLPPHEHYVEPFGGGGAILLRKPRSPEETYNDINADVFNFFRVLRGRTQELVHAVNLTPWHRLEFELALEERTGDELEDARRFFVASWQSIGQIKPGGKRMSGWRYIKTVNPKWPGPAHTWAKIEHLYTVADRLIGVQLECRDYRDVLRCYDKAETLFYLDPPYLHETRTSGQKYSSELGVAADDADNHAEIAELARGLSGLCLISHYPCALYDDLYRDWVKVTTVTKTGSRASQKDREEALYISPRAAEGLRGGLFGGLKVT